MIPQQTPGNETPVNGLKNRVTACRRRLRCSRLTQKAGGWERRRPRPRQVNDTGSGGSRTRSPYDLATAASEALQFVEQEVGIT